MKLLKYAWLLSFCCLIGCQSKNNAVETNTATQMPEWNATPLVEMNNELGEGAIWNHKTKEFWHVDIEGKQFFTTKLSTLDQKVYDVEERIGTIVPNDSGQAIVALQSGIYQFDLNENEKSLIVNPLDTIANIRFNDGKCDPAGRLWVGSMGLDQKAFRASLYSIAQDIPQIKLDSITISNGIVWTRDSKTMYYIDTPDENVKAYDFDVESGQISNERVVIEIGGIGFPDGMAIDSEDKLWIALWNGGIVGRWDPETGQMIGKVQVPAHNITSCAFVGDQLDSLIITSARVDMSEEELTQYPLAGSLFVVVPGIQGVESTFYKSSEVTP